MKAKFVSVLDLMREDWDRRAREDALGHACPAVRGRGEDAFWSSGDALVREHVAPDLAALRTAPGDAGHSVLEIGCGPGRLLRPLAALVGSVHGVDVSGEMLRVARRLLDGEPGIRLHQGDGMTLQCLRRERFDLIVSYDTLSHLPDRRLLEYVLRQAGQRLEPEGLCKLQLDAERHDEAELPRLLEPTGLRVEKTARFDKDLWIWARVQ